MDGNRRWAKERGLSSHEGHTEGFQKVKDILAWCRDAGVRNTIFYGLSTENWKRSPLEIQHLLLLFKRLIDDLKQEIEKPEGNNVRIRFLGDLSRFSAQLQSEMKILEEKTAGATDYTLGMALSYGGRLEIVEAAKKLAAQGSVITEETFSQALWTAGIPDPDLIIRTGGAQRLSNFLPWQSVYSELMFTTNYWPAFERTEFEEMLAEYARRVRNFGI